MARCRKGSSMKAFKVRFIQMVFALASTDCLMIWKPVREDSFLPVAEASNFLMMASSAASDGSNFKEIFCCIPLNPLKGTLKSMII